MGKTGYPTNGRQLGVDMNFHYSEEMLSEMQGAVMNAYENTDDRRDCLALLAVNELLHDLKEYIDKPRWAVNL